MNRYEFIEELKVRLKKLPYDEIKNAIEYYEEYFDDAGYENEKTVIEELISPSKVASQIIADFAIKDFENSKPSVKKGLSTVWFIVLAIFASPIAFPVAFALVVLVFSIVLAVLISIFSIGFGGLALALGGIVCLFMSFSIIIKEFATSIFFIGFSFLSFGVGIAILTAMVIISKKFFIWFANRLNKFLKRRNNL